MGVITGSVWLLCIVVATGGQENDQQHLTEWPNIARGLNAIASSVHSQTYSLPKYALDGSHEGNYWRKSCYHSTWGRGASHWWAVDLGAPAAIVSVNITNRQDCCGFRLQNVTVATTDSLPTGGSSWNPSCHPLHICGTVNEVPGAWWSTACNHRARIVVVYRTTRLTEVPLQFCEVEVRGQYLITEWPNLAKGRPAFSSSSHGSGYAPPENAVDGSYNANFRSRSCFHSVDRGGVTHWWAVDLGAPAAIVSVNITNRKDCCGYRLRDTTVATTDYLPTGASRWQPGSHSLQVCGTMNEVPGAWWSVACNHQARMVVIYKTRSVYGIPLQFCEVEVHGQFLIKGCENCGANEHTLITVY